MSAWRETERLYSADWGEWVECPECGSDSVAIIHRTITPGADSAYLWCEDCGRFAGQGPGIEGDYIGQDPGDLEYGFTPGGEVGERHFRRKEDNADV